MDLDLHHYPILKRLLDSNIVFELFTHKPVFTVAEGQDLMKNIPGRGSKNLFLRDKKGQRFFLVTVSEEKRVDLNALAGVLGSDRFSFGSPEKMKEFLSLEPGSVTPLGLLFDGQHRVEAFIDEDLVHADLMQIHPMKNDATIVLAGRSLLKLLEGSGRKVTVVTIPTKIDAAANV